MIQNTNTNTNTNDIDTKQNLAVIWVTVSSWSKLTPVSTFSGAKTGQQGMWHSRAVRGAAQNSLLE